MQKTTWKGSNTRSNGDGSKLFYHCVDRKRNEGKVIFKEEYVRVRVYCGGEKSMCVYVGWGIHIK